MLRFEKLARHADLMQRMGHAVGADLDVAVSGNRLDPVTLRAAVLRCSTCLAAEQCEHWLEAHDAADGAPAYCRNRDLLAALRG